MTPTEQVAEAIWDEISADDPTWSAITWDALDDQLRERYRGMAQAAIDALQLTVETSQRRESYGYYVYPTRSRLVGPWFEGSTEQ